MPASNSAEAVTSQEQVLDGKLLTVQCIKDHTIGKLAIPFIGDADNIRAFDDFRMFRHNPFIDRMDDLIDRFEIGIRIQEDIDHCPHIIPGQIADGRDGMVRQEMQSTIKTLDLCRPQPDIHDSAVDSADDNVIADIKLGLQDDEETIDDIVDELLCAETDRQTRQDQRRQ